MPSCGFDVCVIGNAGIDTNIYLSSDQAETAIESAFTENIDYVGQAGGYSARGYAQLGYRTAFIGAVGDDAFGQMVKRSFGHDRIDMKGIFSDPQGTARSINLITPDGRRRNYYDGKGHMSILPDMAICSDILHQSRLVHFNIPNWARHLLPIARKAGCKIACDIQDVMTAHDAYRRDFIQQSDFLFFSAVNCDDPVKTMETLIHFNHDLIIVSGRGELGCALGTKDGVQFFNPLFSEKPVIDTNGAGDALAVGFLSTHVLEGRSIQDSIIRGQLNARYVCTQKGSTDHLLTADQLNHLENSQAL